MEIKICVWSIILLFFIQLNGHGTLAQPAPDNNGVEQENSTKAESSPVPGQTSEPVGGTEPGQTSETGSDSEPGSAPVPGQALVPGGGSEPGQTSEQGSGSEPGSVPVPGQASEPGSSPLPGQSSEPGSATGPESSPVPGQASEPGSGSERGSAPETGNDPEPENVSQNAKVDAELAEFKEKGKELLYENPKKSTANNADREFNEVRQEFEDALNVPTQNETKAEIYEILLNQREVKRNFEKFIKQKAQIDERYGKLLNSYNFLLQDDTLSDNLRNQYEARRKQLADVENELMRVKEYILDNLANTPIKF